MVEARPAETSRAITREALANVPGVSRPVDGLPISTRPGFDLGPTDGKGMVRLPPYIGFGTPGTSAVVQTCKHTRRVFVFAPKITATADVEACRREAEGRGRDADPACDCRPATFKADPYRVEIPDTSSFHYSKALWAIPVVAGGAVAAARAGGGGGSSATTSSPPAPAAPSTSPSTAPSSAPFPRGPYLISWRVIEDARQSAQFVQLQSVSELVLELNGATLTILGPSPWVTLVGAVSPSGQFMVSGAGRLAGRDQVGVTAVGRVVVGGASASAAAATLEATVTVGEDGSLGPPLPHRVVYGLTGTERP
jgi:hypothetical protein